MLQRRPELPVMMVTASGYDERRRRADAYAAAEFITKPVDFDVLKEQLRQLLTSTVLRRSPANPELFLPSIDWYPESATVLPRSRWQPWASPRMRSLSSCRLGRRTICPTILPRLRHARSPHLAFL